MSQSNKVLVEVTKKGANKIATGQGDYYPQGTIVYMGRAAYESHSEEGYVTDARPGDQPNYTPKPEGFTENDRLAGVVTDGLLAQHKEEQAALDAKAALIASIPDDVLAKAQELMAAGAKGKGGKAADPAKD